MSRLGEHPDLIPVVNPDDVAFVHSWAPVRFPSGHRFRAGHCLVCRELIGGNVVSIIGVAALDGDVCDCGGIVSDLFLVHDEHLPLTPDALQAAIHRGLKCDADNQ